MPIGRTYLLFPFLLSGFCYFEFEGFNFLNYFDKRACSPPPHPPTLLSGRESGGKSLSPARRFEHFVNSESSLVHFRRQLALLHVLGSCRPGEVNKEEIKADFDYRSVTPQIVTYYVVTLPLFGLRGVLLHIQIGFFFFERWKVISVLAASNPH